jgi:hypothetical protein
MTMFYWLKFETPPNQEGQVSVFIFPRIGVVQLYLQAVGSLFVAFDCSQGEGGSILPACTRDTNLLAYFMFILLLGLLVCEFHLLFSLS